MGKTGKEKQTLWLDLVKKSVDVLKLKYHTWHKCYSK